MLKRNDSLVSTKCCYLNENSIKYIVVHYTACYAPAKNFVDNIRFERVEGSAHDFVDDDSWYLAIEHKHGAWSVGDDQGYGRYPNGITNTNSLNIEMVAAAYSLPSEKTIKNTAEIVAYYMKLYKVPIERVVRHYDASYKQCPYGMHGANNTQWNKFKAKVKSYYDGKEVKKLTRDFESKYINMMDWCPRWRLFNLYSDEVVGEINPKGNGGLSYEILGCLENTEKQKKFIIKTSYKGLVYVLHWDDGNSSITDVPRYGVKQSEAIYRENEELKEKIEQAKKILE